MIGELRRRLFAWGYARAAPRLTQATLPYRRRLVENLDGRVLEVGCGPGNNFGLYPAGLEVIAVDRNEHMLARARAAASEAAASITVEPADIHALPYPDGRFDHVVSTLVLCSVDQRRALDEMRRVLRPGGSLRLWEHVRSQRGWIAFLQRAYSPIHGLYADGCHLDRDTAGAVRAGGFEVLEEERVTVIEPHMLLIATRPAD